MSELSNQEFLNKLEQHPELLGRFKKLLLLVEGTGKDEIRLADAAEDAVTENLQKLGNELLRNWAVEQELRVSNNFKSAVKSAELHSKKNSTGTPSMEK